MCPWIITGNKERHCNERALDSVYNKEGERFQKKKQ
jgi:hypothetical protein